MNPSSAQQGAYGPLWKQSTGPDPKILAKDEKLANEDLNSDGSVNSGGLNGAICGDSSTKKKTPMCLVNELARHHKLQPQYRLTGETGPPHQKQFTVTLKLGEEEYTESGLSIKKAQHAAAELALANTKYTMPPPKTKSRIVPSNHTSKSITPTVELNTIAMKLGLPTVYTNCHDVVPHPESVVPVYPNVRPNHGPRDFHSFENSKPEGPYVNPAFQARPPMFQPRFSRHNLRGQYHRYPVPPMIYRIRLTVGDIHVIGQGHSAQAARHHAASLALEEIRNRKLSPVEEANVNGKVVDVASPDADSANKSPVSLVHELALKLGQNVEFSVISESGPPHMKMFTIRCMLGQLTTEGEGNCKKFAKKKSAENMLAELKKAYPNGIPGSSDAAAAAAPATRVRSKVKQATIRKKPRNLVKEVAASSAITTNGASTAQDPISRLMQRQQARKEKEPVFEVVSERGIPRQPEFIVQVAVGDVVAQGIGAKKKDAKRAAALKLLELLDVSQGSPSEGNPDTGAKDATASSGRQNIPGLLVVGASAAKLKTEDPVNPSKTDGTPTPPVKTSFKGTSGMRPKAKLLYLAQLQGFEVEFTDFPKGTKGEFLSLVMLSNDPSSVCHGTGQTMEEAHDDVSSKVLQRLAEIGLDSIARKKDAED